MPREAGERRPDTRPDPRSVAVRRDWELLAREDPLWAVYVAPGTRGGQWDLDEFLATGTAEVDRVLSQAARHGLAQPVGRALDIGCGVGRLSQALARHADEVIGFDVSATMIDHARRLDRTGRCRFVLDDGSGLGMFGDSGFDLVYTSLVLQHLTRREGLDLLRTIPRLLAPQGFAAVQVASRPRLSPKGLAFGLLPHPVLGWAQRRLLSYPAPMRMTRLGDRSVRTALAAGGGRVVATEEDRSYGGHWRYRRYFAVAAA